MKCEVKNVQSAEVWAIPPEGMVFGRAGGPANITVSDQSVSKRHARIYLKDGTWVLEDLKSVNGTVVNNRRITEPVPLQPGFVFALSKHQFEIVTADGAAPPMGTRSSKGSGNGRDQNGRDNGAEAPASDPRRSKASNNSQRPQRPGGPSQPVQVPDAEPLLPPEPSSRRGSPPQQPYDDFPGSSAGDDAQQDAYLDEAVQGGGAGAVLAALPKAIAYYMAAVPLMALNPLGTIRRGAEEPKLKAMGPLELIAFILPVQIFANLLTAWAAGIGTLIGGGGFLFGAFFPVVPLIIAVVVAVISGFITHPLLRFFIDRLFKGESTDKTRTNYMIMTQTASALLAIPTAVTLLLEPVIVRLSASISPIALLLIVPALLSAVTSPLVPLVAWTWMKAFRVLPIIQKICFVLLILSVVGGVAQAGMGILHAVQRMASGGGGSGGSVDVATVDPEEAAKAAVAAAKAAGLDGDALKKIEEDARNAAEAAKKAAAEAKDAAAKDAKDEPKDAKDEPKDAKDSKDSKDAKDEPKDAKDEPKDAKDEPKDAKDEPKDPPKDEPKDPPKDAAIVKEPVEDAPRGSGAFGDYKRKRDFVELAIANDPSLLKNEKISDAYKRLSKQTYLGIADAEEDVFGRKKKYNPELKLYLDRYKEMKIYDRTKPVVDELYKLLKK